MSVARHASAILKAWHLADEQRFTAELDDAIESCQRPCPSPLEFEQRELLHSVAAHLKQARTGQLSEPTSLAPDFALLRHLRDR